MKIIVTKETVEEIEINVPHFFKCEYRSGTTYYAILKNYGLSISGGTATVTCTEAISQFIGNPENLECSQEEFLAAYDTAVAKIRAELIGK